MYYLAQPEELEVFETIRFLKFQRDSQTQTCRLHTHLDSTIPHHFGFLMAIKIMKITFKIRPYFCRFLMVEVSCLEEKVSIVHLYAKNTHQILAAK